MLENQVNLSVYEQKMIDACINHCHNSADKIYIYMYSERNTTSATYFYECRDQIFTMSQISEMDSRLVRNKQSELDTLREVNDQHQNILSEISKCGDPVPTSIKYIYDCHSESVSREVTYDQLVHPYNYDKTDDDILEDWINELKTALGQPLDPPVDSDVEITDPEILENYGTPDMTFEQGIEMMVADTIDVFMTHSRGKADKIFVAILAEQYYKDHDFFYEMKDTLVDVYSASVLEPTIDCGFSQRMELVDLMRMERQSLAYLCRRFDQAMPKRFNIVHDVQTGKTNVDLSYESIITSADQNVRKTYKALTCDWRLEMRYKYNVSNIMTNYLQE